MEVPVADGGAPHRVADKASADASIPDVMRLLALLGALLAIAAERAVGAAFYNGFALPQGTGMNMLLAAEVSAFALFIAFGGVAWALLTFALGGTPLVARAARAVNAAARTRGLGVSALLAVLLSAACWT